MREFAAKLKKKFKIDRLIFFGSRARGDWLKGSDYDFVIVSPDFEKTDFLDRAALVARKCNAYLPADLLCYTPEEFDRKKKEICIVREAVKTGVSII